MDVCLILVGLLALWIVPAFAESDHSSGFEKLLVVRGIRLLRLVRVLRMVRHFKARCARLNSSTNGSLAFALNSELFRYRIQYE